MQFNTTYYTIEIDVDGSVTDQRLAESPEQAEEFARSEMVEIIEGAIKRNLSGSPDIDIDVAVDDVYEANEEFTPYDDE
jgi:hypothetical protein